MTLKEARKTRAHRLLKVKAQGKDVKALQVGLNNHLKKPGGFHMLKADGILGDATMRAALHVAWNMGISYRSLKKGLTKFTQRKIKGTMPRSIFDRRRVQKRRKENTDNPFLPLHPDRPPEQGGLTWMDGKWVATWIADDLLWYRNHGLWHGIVVSGWRDPVYSQHLCYQMCGRPSCPGRCAGTASRHVGKVYPNGAADVTSYTELKTATHSHPRRIRNDVLPSDLVHYSSDGH